MSEKIHAEHTERTAYVYVRQSSNQQVRDHREGRERQYALADLARKLECHKVVVNDDDLGRSGSGLQERPGFARLLTAVCQGDAGAVLALEASRLARNNRDWHHLIDLCGITATLIIDEGGVYDPRLLNDRLLLGLKGSLAEFELGLLRQRARACFEQKVGRGHTHCHSRRYQPTCPRLGCELHSLIGVEYLRSATCQGLFQHVQAERSVQGVRQPPGDHIAAVPINHRRQVHESAWQRHIRDIRTPHLIRTLDHHISQ